MQNRELNLEKKTSSNDKRTAISKRKNICSKFSKIGKFTLSVVLSLAIMFGAVGCVNQPVDPTPSSSTSANPNGNPDTTTSPNPSTNPSVGKMPPLSQMGKTEYRFESSLNLENYLSNCTMLGIQEHMENKNTLSTSFGEVFFILTIVNENSICQNFTFIDLNGNYIVGNATAIDDNILKNANEFINSGNEIIAVEYFANLFKYKTEKLTQLTISNDLREEFIKQNFTEKLNNYLKTYNQDNNCNLVYAYDTTVKDGKLAAIVYDFLTMQSGTVQIEGDYILDTDSLITKINEMSFAEITLNAQSELNMSALHKQILTKVSTK